MVLTTVVSWYTPAYKPKFGARRFRCQWLVTILFSCVIHEPVWSFWSASDQSEATQPEATQSALSQSSPSIDAIHQEQAKILRDLRDKSYLLNEDEIYAKLKAIEAVFTEQTPAALRHEFARQYCRVANNTQEGNGLEYANQHLLEAKQRGDTASVIEFMRCQGTHQLLAGEVVAAESAFNAAYLQSQESNDIRAQADSLSARGDFYSYTANLALALADLLQAQRLYEALKLDDAATGNLLSLAHVYRRMSDYEKAREYYQSLLTRLQAAKNQVMEAETYMFIGWTHIEAQQYQLAEESFLASRQLHDALSNEDASMRSYFTLVDNFHYGTISTLLGRHEEALKAFDAVWELSKELRFVQIYGLMAYFRAHAIAGLDQNKQALIALEEAEQALGKLGNQRYIARIHRLRSEVYAKLGQYMNSRNDLLRYLDEKEKLDQKLRANESARLRIEFDTERTVSENRRLQAEQQLQTQRVEALEETRRWQLAFMVLGGSVILVLLVRQLRKARRLYILAMTDELTRLPNRRAIYLFAAEAWRDCSRHHLPLAAIVFDIDHFKRINDTYGHDQGDEVLRQVANSARAALRGRDRIGRIGGEEFLVILPGATVEQAQQAAERLRLAVASTAFHAEQGDSKTPTVLPVTISLGVTSRRNEDPDLDAVVARADSALYQAKRGGRNRVSVDELQAVIAAASV